MEEYKKVIQSNKLKESAPTLNKKFELPDRPYSDKLENRITFKTRTGYCLQLLTPKMMKLLGST